MSNRRHRLIGATVLLTLGVATAVFHFARHQLVFRPVDVFWYVTEEYKPVDFFGDREVEGLFEYRGPKVSHPPDGVIRGFLRSWHVLPAWKPPPLQFQDIVLSDKTGNELARISTQRQSALRGVRNAIRLQDSDTRLYVSWYFSIPPTVDRSQPIHFATTFSINGLAALPVRVTIPPTGRPPATRQSI